MENDKYGVVVYLDDFDELPCTDEEDEQYSSATSMHSAIHRRRSSVPDFGPMSSSADEGASQRPPNALTVLPLAIEPSSTSIGPVSAGSSAEHASSTNSRASALELRRRRNTAPVSPSLGSRSSSSLSSFSHINLSQETLSSGTAFLAENHVNGNSHRSKFKQYLKNHALSLGTIVALGNLLIIGVTVAVITVVSYLVSQQVLYNSAVQLSSEAGQDTITRLENSIQLIDLAKSSLVSTFLFNTTNLSQAPHIFNYMSNVFASQTSADIQAMYVVMPNNAVMWTGYAGLTDETFGFMFNNFSYSPTTLFQYLQNPNCADLDFTCSMVDYVALVATYTGFNVTQRPYYELSVANPSPSWTPVYLYAQGILGITSYIPQFYDNGTLQLVAAADVTLVQIQASLTEFASDLSTDSSTRIYIVVPELFQQASCAQYGLLIAASSSTSVLSPMNLNCIIAATDSEDSIIQLTSQQLVDRYGPTWQNVSNTVESDSISFVVEGLMVEVQSYSNDDGSISWLVVVVVAQSVFLGELGNVLVILLPAVAVGVTIFAILMSILLSHLISRPLKQVTTKLRAMAQLQFTEDKPRASVEMQEVARMNDALEAMTTGLKSFTRYVPQEIVLMLVRLKREAVLGVDETDLTIFFSDIADFTTISETMSPNNLVTLMSEYLDAMSQIILENQGVVDKFIGDAVMAFWNAPFILEDHAAVGCKAALQSQAKLAELRLLWAERKYPEINARIGLNTGTALVGNLGAPDRLNYTCIGDNVNLASRLEGLNKAYKTSIMLSEYTYDKVRDRFLCRPLDLVAVKGKSVPVMVFELVDFTETADAEVAREVMAMHTAFQLYISGKFSIAKRYFQRYLVNHPGDASAKQHVDLCEKYISEPPPEDWDGRVISNEK